MTTLSRTLTQKRRQRRSRRWSWFRRLAAACGFTFATLALGGFLFLFGTETGEELREWAAGTLLTTQHDYWAPYTFLPDDKLEELKRQIRNPVVINSEADTAKQPDARPVDVPAPEKPRDLIEIEEIDETRGSYYFKGKLMYISDPNRVHLVVTTRKDRGDLLDEFAKKYNAIGIVNASGFSDPDGYGRGTKAYGVVIKDGRILQGYNPKSGETALGITYDGRLVTGNYSAQELVNMGVRDAMSFRPQLIVNGKNLFADKPAKSWGIQPRTAVGQKADGTIVFLVIDGRQPGHSIGASMNDVAEILASRGVVNAMAMDGGSSSMMLYNGEAITRTSCPYERGRYLPNAWAVY
ncbi:phosphodiester glycosidase family protein [Brevibacillus thermoruber]|jgi:exopolysaccharide biosynthesis protein|uniref:Phosphodiester glycosidase family protein n=1 Tax=Brevibacillus thermoruber TaxID=33942 RepID=A0A9X3TMJ0_9BACL|nr:phosphodiester glycosidase family protein [Brevibacillus thermoruber]MDA5107242.1 phosphodiester glycosidase family protein [Brevibacillus thermoruber]